ncbi:uncharacterized protein LOC121919589 isoform X2 [Sceloporus undulatus]|uniref:uncharacterized protein LOC121919589 isoform X2 n=1 Tax=Sceloporus undulatus TaxID=8520 RepID=UPI001C4B8714|nr:uncharacterized protein LOC121919589 isoform X2 [Sceloporus undulatus]
MPSHDEQEEEHPDSGDSSSSQQPLDPHALLRRMSAGTGSSRSRPPSHAGSSSTTSSYRDRSLVSRASAAASDGSEAEETMQDKPFVYVDNKCIVAQVWHNRANCMAELHNCGIVSFAAYYAGMFARLLGQGSCGSRIVSVPGMVMCCMCPTFLRHPSLARNSLVSPPP